jgi:hypothetical protein
MIRQPSLVPTFALLGALLCVSALADEPVTPTVDASPSQGAKSQASAPSNDPAAGGETVDDLITNNNLRAFSGSLSRWSIASQFNYEGGTLASPFDQDRPNISDASGNTIKADLDGAISVKYNLNAKNALMAGFGIRWIAPLSPGALPNYSGTRFDAMNPYLQYQYVYKWLGVQSVLQVQGTLWTQADQTAIGSFAQLNVDQENMYEIGHSGLSLGASTFVQYQWFNKSVDDTGADLASQQSVYEFSFSPILEYQLTEKINLRTLVFLLTYEHYKSDPEFNFVHDNVYQSVGVGFSVTRDIFLYPNIQFLPTQLQASLTNVGLSATINLF